MADIKKIKLPSGTELNLKDYRIPGVDTTPTSGSDNIVTSGGIYTALNNAIGSVYRVKGTKATYADLPSSGNVAGDVWNVTAAYGNYPAGTNWVWTGSEWDALGGEIDLSGKQDVLTFDSTPTANSTNPVTSGGVYQSVIDTSLVTSAALNDLNTRVETIEENKVDSSSLSSVALSGSYSDLDNKPTIPAAPGKLTTTSTTALSTATNESLSGTINLHKVAKTGTYSDLIGKPTIPSAPGTLNTNNTTAQTVSSSEALSGTIKLHKIAKTGSYNDLLNKPTIDSKPTQNSTNLVSSGGVNEAIGDVYDVFDNYALINGEYTEPFAVEKLNLASSGSGNPTTLGDWPNGSMTLSSSKRLTVQYSTTVQPVGQSSPSTSTITKTVAYTDDIPSAVTESTVSGWGFTKNTGTVTGVTMNGTTYNPTSGVVNLGTISVDTSDCEKVANRVTSISSSSTNTQYPTAKAVYDYIGNMESVLDAIIAGTYQTT